MTNYIRVIPRDLFNEAKLLKCMGRLSICADMKPPGFVDVRQDDETSPEGWIIKQDASNGSIFVANITVLVAGKEVHCYTTINAKADWPMWADYEDKCAQVFDATGHLTLEFLDLTSEGE